MLIDYQPLSWYTDRLRNGVRFSLTKHSDASLYCMQGREGGDCNGCAYTPELRKALLDGLRAPHYGLSHGVQRISDRDKYAFDELFVKERIPRSWVQWQDTGVLAVHLMEGRLYPFIEALRTVPRLVIVSNARIRAIKDAGILAHHDFIETPESNTYADRVRLYEEIQHREEAASDQGVYLFSCGMAACAMIPVLHMRHPESSFVDVGHIWDALLGNKLRYYLNDVKPETLAANLRPEGT